MNPFDRFSQKDGEAVLKYMDADFAVLKPGDYVVCAVTGKHIALEALKYWNVDKQEPYFDAQASLQGFRAET